MAKCTISWDTFPGWFVKLFFRKRLTIPAPCGIIIKSSGRNTPERHLGVAQLVARYLGVVEAASSSLVTQTKPDLFELVKSLKRSGFLYAKRDYPRDKTDSPSFLLYI